MGNDHHLQRSSFIYPQDEVVKEEKSLMKILPLDDSDDYELAEVGCEIIMVEGQTCSVPYELYDLLDLKEILSLGAWNCHLTEDERFSLAMFLPDMDQQMFWLTVKELLTGDDLFFGSPLEKFYTGLKGGLYSPQITCLRNSLRSLQKNEYYHRLRSYHENMTRAFDEMKQVWDRYRPTAVTVEERIHIWNSRRNYKPKFVVDLNAFPDEDILNKGDGNVETLPLSKKAKYAGQADDSAILLNGLACNTNRRAKGVLKLKPVVADAGRSLVIQALPGKLEQPSKRMPKGVLKIKHKYDPLDQVKPRGGKLEQIPSDIWGVHADAPGVSPPRFAWKKDELNFCEKLPIFCQINRDGSTYRSPVVMQGSQKEWHDQKKNWNIVCTQQSMPIRESSAISNKECLQPAPEKYQEKRLNAIISAAGSRIPNNCNDKHDELFTNPSEHLDYRIKDDTSDVAISGVEKCLMFPLTYKRKKPYRKLNQVDSPAQQQEVAVNLESATPSGTAKLRPMAIKIKFRGWKGQNG